MAFSAHGSSSPPSIPEVKPFDSVGKYWAGACGNEKLVNRQTQGQND